MTTDDPEDDPVGVWFLDRTYSDDEQNVITLTYATPELGCPSPDHRQRHLEGGDGVDGVGDVGGHEDRFAVLEFVALAVEDDGGGAVEHLQERVVGGGVFA
ncbi:hypothetical protein [Halalkaliarchaeum sp. AArc-CO]|uniref:hypothetical protein n=1 Tax=Halalkaliarchaeum sp. AArc-CO TaxID=2866381 RepID=UPI0031F30A5D